MPDRESFKTNYPPTQPLAPTGGLLNKIGRELNTLQPPMGSSFSQYSGLTSGSPGDAPFIFGVATITGADNTCQSDSVLGEVGPPCAVDQKYQAQFRYWDGDANVWANIAGTLRIDAGGYHNGSPNLGPIPGYVVGDQVPAYYDPKRRWFIPVHSPAEQICAAHFAHVDPPSVLGPGGPYPNTATISLEQWRNNKWLRATEDLHLYMPPSTQGGVASAAMVGTVWLRNNDMLRLTGCTQDDIFAQKWGIRLILLGRLHNGTAEHLTPGTAIYSNTQILGGWVTVASVQHRFKDALRIDNMGTFLKIVSNDPGDQWVANIEFYAECAVSEETASSQSSSSSTSSSSTSSASSSSLSSSSTSSKSSSSTSSKSSSSPSSSSSSQSDTSTSSSQSVSESSSSSHDCFQFVECFEFDMDACEMTVTWGEACFPRGSGITVSHDIDPPC